MSYLALVLASMVSLPASTYAAGYPDSVGTSLVMYGKPQDICMHPSGQYAYVGCRHGNIKAVDTSTWEISHQIYLPTSNFQGVACHPSGEYLYATDSDNSCVYVLEAPQLLMADTLAMWGAYSLIGVEAGPSGEWVVATSDNRFYLIDAVTNTLEDMVDVSGKSRGAAFTPSGETVYVARYIQSAACMVTVPEMEPEDVYVGGVNYDVHVQPDGGYAFLTLPEYDALAMLRLSDNVIEEFITGLGPTPRRVCGLPDGTYLYVGCDEGENVDIVQAVSGALVGSVAVGAGRKSVCAAPDGSFVLVTCRESNTLSVLVPSPMGTEPEQTPGPGSGIELPGPNPCRRSTDVRLRVTGAAAGHFSVYDAAGRRLPLQCSADYPEGLHEVSVRFPAPGVYVLRLEAADGVHTRLVTALGGASS